MGEYVRETKIEVNAMVDTNKMTYRKKFFLSHDENDISLDDDIEYFDDLKELLIAVSDWYEMQTEEG